MRAPWVLARLRAGVIGRGTAPEAGAARCGVALRAGW
jgi:hypothetical protein